MPTIAIPSESCVVSALIGRTLLSLRLTSRWPFIAHHRGPLLLRARGGFVGERGIVGFVAQSRSARLRMVGNWKSSVIGNLALQLGLATGDGLW